MSDSSRGIVAFSGTIVVNGEKRKHQYLNKRLKEWGYTPYNEKKHSPSDINVLVASQRALLENHKLVQDVKQQGGLIVKEEWVGLLAKGSSSADRDPTQYAYVNLKRQQDSVEISNVTQVDDKGKPRKLKKAAKGQDSLSPPSSVHDEHEDRRRPVKDGNSKKGTSVQHGDEAKGESEDENSSEDEEKQSPKNKKSSDGETERESEWDRPKDKKKRSPSPKPDKRDKDKKGDKETMRSKTSKSKAQQVIFEDEDGDGDGDGDENEVEVKRQKQTSTKNTKSKSHKRDKKDERQEETSGKRSKPVLAKLIEEDEDTDEDEDERKRKGPQKKTKSKLSKRIEEDEDEYEDEDERQRKPSTKKTKSKLSRRIEEDEDDDVDGGGDDDGDEDERQRKSPKKKNKSKLSKRIEEDEDEDDGKEGEVSMRKNKKKVKSGEREEEPRLKQKAKSRKEVAMASIEEDNALDILIKDKKNKPKSRKRHTEEPRYQRKAKGRKEAVGDTFMTGALDIADDSSDISMEDASMQRNTSEGSSAGSSNDQGSSNESDSEGSSAGSSSDLDSSSGSDSDEEPEVTYPPRGMSMGPTEIDMSDTARVLEMRRHPNGSPGPCRLAIDCIMPRGGIRVFEPGRMLLTEKAWVVNGRQYALQKQAFMDAGGKQMWSRSEADLMDYSPEELLYKNIALAPDGSVSILAALPGEKFWSLWTRSAFRAAFTKKTADDVLNLLRVAEAGQRKLPDKTPTKAARNKKEGKYTEEMKDFEKNRKRLWGRLSQH